jgi:hypothetical protein
MVRPHPRHAARLNSKPCVIHVPFDAVNRPHPPGRHLALAFRVNDGAQKGRQLRRRKHSQAARSCTPPAATVIVEHHKHLPSSVCNVRSRHFGQNAQ